ncbi:hypothetical protein [Rhodococcus opacus]|uniref:hypothetical protein n=1 Tax=Rhodococcus opacus TaxID=37919 RepID=UPI001C2094DB|nr:hypothetical protein [Rhodococcus opacus]
MCEMRQLPKLFEAPVFHAPHPDLGKSRSINDHRTVPRKKPQVHVGAKLAPDHIAQLTRLVPMLSAGRTALAAGAR